MHGQVPPPLEVVLRYTNNSQSEGILYYRSPTREPARVTWIEIFIAAYQVFILSKGATKIYVCSKCQKANEGSVCDTIEDCQFTFVLFCFLKMGSFKRSPSKMLWSEESAFWRHNISTSSGSQDSGFSDTETSPPMHEQHIHTNSESRRRRLLRDVFKELPASDKNLSASFREKKLQDKKTSTGFDQQKLNKSFDDRWTSSPTRTPKFYSEPPKRQQRQTDLYQNKQCPVKKNLFNVSPTPSRNGDQYAKSENIVSGINSNNTCHGLMPELIVSLPLPNATSDNRSHKWNTSAPVVLRTLTEEDGREYESGSDSELENLFEGCSESPKHTSTPNMRHTRRKAQLYIKNRHKHERTNQLELLLNNTNDAVQVWTQNIRHLYEAECMTTLQCKSVATELNQKVLFLASKVAGPMKDMLLEMETIETEFEKLKRETKYVGPLAQNLVGALREFLEQHLEVPLATKIIEHCDDLRSYNSVEDIPKLVNELHSIWCQMKAHLLTTSVLDLVNRLENPISEMELRAVVTAITFLTLKNDFLISYFVNAGAVPSLIAFCEKCDASSLRTIILRALTTLCNSGVAVRQLEKAFGVQLVADIITDDARPEPEISESVALLAQITAPWIDVDHRLRGIEQEAKKLVKALTAFIASTKCCQNFLLSVAALANLTTVEPQCVEHILSYNTITTIFRALKEGISSSWVYIFEQVAILIVNMSASEEARKVLIKENAPALMTHCLHGADNRDVERRLQQTVIIGLSRLCNERAAAEQIVQCGGAEKLVKLCRERKERYNNDAVLIASLATLRKIVDVCGASVVSPQDAQELIEPRLLDSFLTYSTQNESYV